jgi:hypothetical protein
MPAQLFLSERRDAAAEAMPRATSATH